MTARLTRSVVSCLHKKQGILLQSTIRSSSSRAFSSNGNSDNAVNSTTSIDHLVTGLTTDRMEKDPVLQEYMRVNFPSLFETEQEKIARSQETTTTNWGAQRRARPKPALNIRSIQTLKRCPETEEGSNVCFRMREQDNLIPGVIYGTDQTTKAKERIFVKTPRSILQSELDRYHYWEFQGRVYDLTVYESPEQLEAQEAGTVHRVVPRSVQLHPVNDRVYCCNFLRYYPGRPIKVPVTMINEEESPALKRDGYLIPINKTVEVVVDEGVDIPEVLEVECTGLHFKQVIRLDRVMFPDGVRPSEKVLKHPDFIIGPIHGGRGGGAEAEAAAEEE